MAKKRVVIKKGNVFCIEVDKQYKRYFQYIDNDWTQLNGAVIRMFKKRYSFEENPKIEEIVQDEVDFYAHVLLRQGVIDDIWYKVGTSEDKGDLKHILFKTTTDIKLNQETMSVEDVDPDKNWRVWYMNQPFIFVGELPEKYKYVDEGSVYPYTFILHKLRYGKYPQEGNSKK